MTIKRTKRKVSKSSNSGERLATLEAQAAAVVTAAVLHAEQDSKTHEKIFAQLERIEQSLARQRGFVAGVTFVVTAIAGAIAFAINYVLGRPA